MPLPSLKAPRAKKPIASQKALRPTRTRTAAEKPSKKKAAASPKPTSQAPAVKKTVKSAAPLKKSSGASALQYVLDTNVLLHDPTAIFRFQEHDIYIPLVVLEELDKHKKGTADIARNARQVTRMLADMLVDGSMEAGFPLTAPSGGSATGRLYFRGEDDEAADTVLGVLEQDKADNKILACAMGLLKSGHNTVLVTKDINLRVKAMASDIPAQDYRSDKVLSDEDVLPSGFIEVDDRFWSEHAAGDNASWSKGTKLYMRLSLALPVNSFLLEANGPKNRIWRVESQTETSCVIYQVSGRNSQDESTMIVPRNDQQRMAKELLEDEEIDFAALLGPAGTGKTLLAVAAGLEQVKKGLYNEVLVTRATVPMGEEIGFLPGTEEDKMNAWLGGTLRDVFSVLKVAEGSPLRQKVEVASMSFMRGRSFQGKFIVIDEAQNLTVQQMHALLTRAGDGSKVICTGNLAQIDSPYLDPGSSGLAWAAKNLHNWKHAGSLILTRGERSRLASYIEEFTAKRSS